MLFSPEEKQIIKEALTIYLQVASQQMPPQMLEPLGEIAKNILQKADKASAGEGGEKTNKPRNISDEWYENVCSHCEKLDFSGCTDPITTKFPGKCDPILKFEFEKSRKK